MALPKIGVSAIDETKAVKGIIANIKDYQSKNWGIGLNGDTFQPDSFLSFFNKRSLTFSYYVVNHGVSIGSPAAYDANIKELERYLKTFQPNEKQDCQNTINELKSYKEKFWAIGLNGDTFQPDGFNKFFAERNLPFLPFVRKGAVSIGEQSAYDKNIATINTYMLGF